MSRKRLVFCLICVLLWPASIFVEGQLHGYTSFLVWKLCVQAGSTSSSRAAFYLDDWARIVALNGFLLGFIPIKHLRTWLANSFARFRYQAATAANSELDPGRPILWAWVLPTAMFLLFFSLWEPSGGRSVLGQSSALGARLAYFFGSLDDSMDRSFDYNAWLYKRLLFTDPMIFLLAYAAAVWVRHYLPDLPSHTLTEAQGSPLIHSAPDPNTPEPTEIHIEHGHAE